MINITGAHNQWITRNTSQKYFCSPCYKGEQVIG